MGDLLAAATAPRSRGGAPHQLPVLLRQLDPGDARVLLQVLGMPHGEVNWAGLRRGLRELGHVVAVSSLQRWGEDVRADPDRFA